MIELYVSGDAQELGIINPVACLITGVRVSADSSVLDLEVDALMRKLESSAESILARPEVIGFTELFARMGYPKQKPAGQRLIEAFRCGGFKRFNNIVDAYNIASALFGSGLGMHDAAQITGDIHIHRAAGYEWIRPLFKSENVQVVTGDLVYSFYKACDEGGEQMLAWLGKRDVDSDEFKVKDDTTSLLLVVLGNAATSEDYNRSACLKAFELIRYTCPEANASFLNVS